MAGAKNPVRGLGIRFQGKVIEVAGVFLYPPRLVKPDDQTAKACDAGRRRLNLEGGEKFPPGYSLRVLLVLDDARLSAVSGATKVRMTRKHAPHLPTYFRNGMRGDH